jgi:hypothetical protein
MEMSEAKRLRMLEDENRKLKKLLTESMLDNAALKELRAKMNGPPRLRQEAPWGRADLSRISSLACGLSRRWPPMPRSRE